MRGEELALWKRPCKPFRTRRHDDLTTTAAAAVGLGMAANPVLDLEGAGAGELPFSAPFSTC